MLFTLYLDHYHKKISSICMKIHTECIVSTLNFYAVVLGGISSCFCSRQLTICLTDFSLCIDCRAKTLNLKNMKEVEYKYKTEDNCVS